MEGLVLWLCSSEEPDSPGGTSVLVLQARASGPKGSVRSDLNYLNIHSYSSGRQCHYPTLQQETEAQERKATCPGTQQRWI